MKKEEYIAPEVKTVFHILIDDIITLSNNGDILEDTGEEGGWVSNPG